MQTDLSTASREMLLLIVAEQESTIVHLQTTIGEMEKRIVGLETRLASRKTPGMPGNKPPTNTPTPRKETRKKRPKGFARVRMMPTEEIDHAVETCPECGTHLCGGWVQRTREVLEIPVVPVQVIAHRFIARICPVCDTRRVPPADVLAGVVSGKQRLGINLVSLIATLREEGRWPVAMIQWYLQTIHQLHLSVGAVVGVLHRTARQARGTVEAVREEIRRSPVVHGDETGLREEGRNGYVWTFSTPTGRYFVRRGRGKGVVDEVLGETFDGVLVSDFYAAYDHYPGLHQRCWAHLLRDIHAVREMYPTDGALVQWAEGVQEIYRAAKAFVHPEERERRRMQEQYEKRLVALCRPYVEDPLAAQRRLCRRILRYIRELFVFVWEPLVPSDNNAAERSLRHLVTSRKISGGTRSPQGTHTKMTLSSLFGTWRARGLNPFQECRRLLGAS